jgi:hypothetical protein
MVRIATSFIRFETVLSLPSVDSSSKKLCYTILKDNQEQTVEFAIDDQYDFSFDKDNNYQVAIGPNDEYIKIIYNRCRETGEKTMENAVNNIDKIVKEKKTTNFIVDLRDNVGGKSSIIRPLIDYLSNNSTSLVTLIDRAVFSSGTLAALDLKDIGSIFVGTGIGATINHFGEVFQINLPNSNLRIQYSTKYFYYDADHDGFHSVCGKNEFDKFISDSNNTKYFKPIIFQPDIYVENKIEDYKNGRDKVLECAVQTLKRLSSNEDIKQVKKIYYMIVV